MPLLPKPYPDEVIGSVVARAVWHNGLSLKAQLNDLYGGNRSYSSFLMSSRLHRLGALAGMDAEELLMQHTVFPYATAFMPSRVRGALKSKALLPREGEDCLSSLTKNASHGVSFRRVCEICIKEDMATFGESYWRREHLLPGALVCTRHGTLLRATNIALRGHAQTNDSLLPHMVKHMACTTGLDFGLLERITCISADALKSGDVAGRAISSSVRRLFGNRFLNDAGCEMSARSPWLSLMVRLGIRIPFASPKHVLFNAFLSQGGLAPAEIFSMYPKPGKKCSDYKLLDRRLSRRLKTISKKAEIKNTRLTVKQLLSDSWSIYRRQRELFPETSEFLLKFRSSAQSERQVGIREYWRRRFPKRYADRTTPAV
jgi:hypothetical protein